MFADVRLRCRVYVNQRGAVNVHTKLTLRMEESLIASAKAFARRSGRSVSQIVADYFALLDAELSDAEEATTPIVESLRGGLHGRGADARALRRELSRPR